MKPFIPRRDAQRTRGYTAVELLMSLALLTIGVTGVVAMQKVTITSNQHAKNLSVATQIAQAWMDQLRADAISWNHPSAVSPLSDLGDTVWLNQILPNENSWFQPAWNANRLFGAAFDAQGRPVDTTTGTDDDDNPAALPPIRYCAHLRLSWLYNERDTMLGNGLIRSEVRVFWAREGQPGAAVCDAAQDPNVVGDEIGTYHFVYNVSAVRQNTLL